jgi:RNA polymerase sigma factor (sigma-70 family)
MSDEHAKDGTTKLSEADRIVGELYLAHGNEVLEFLANDMKLAVEDAEDLMSDTFVKLATRYAGGEPPENPRGWLLVVARNAALEVLERRRASPVNKSLGADGIPSDLLDRAQRRPLSALVSGEMKAVTREALLGLPEIPRKIVELHLGGASAALIAQTLNMHQDKAETILDKALRSVHDRLGAAFSSEVRKADARDYIPTTRGKLLEQLPAIGARYARILLLRHDEGLDSRRMAPKLGMAVEEAERNLARAHELLEKRFSLTPDEFTAILRKAT